MVLLAEAVVAVVVEIDVVDLIAIMTVVAVIAHTIAGVLDNRIGALDNFSLQVSWKLFRLKSPIETLASSRSLLCQRQAPKRTSNNVNRCKAAET